ncbi:MAG: hypothetical protein M1825_003297 [Sarcosagium campestre]|nr:MAG: hypothetical protein M1825_003297 [Sarcosagium campestre]
MFARKNILLAFSFLEVLSFTSATLCTNFVISVTASASTQVIEPPPANLTDPAVFFAYLAKTLTAEPNFTPTTGTFSISVRHCRTGAPNNHQTPPLQFLVHGATYDKTYWEGFGRDEYSWEKFALSQGYDTLAIDSLGNGASDHPDPIQLVQNPLQRAIIHEIVLKLRRGEIARTTYNSIIYVGHSYGSATGVRLANEYPSDFEAVVLTGFSVDSSQVSVALAGAFSPAQTVSQRFANLPQAYLAIASEDVRTKAFYSGDGSDLRVAINDFATQGTTTIGELLPFGSATAPNYRGPVFILTGDNDILYCGQSRTCLPGPKSPVPQTRTVFPNANAFSYRLASYAGHSLNNHFSARDSFQSVHEWLTGNTL